MFAPLRSGLSFTIDSNKVVIALIALLFFIGYPVAVIWGVAFSVIFSINRSAIKRHWQHVFGKTFKATPFIANGNAARPVFWVVVAVLVMAALNHTGPYSVSASIGLAVSGGFIACGFTSDAPTTFSLTESEINPWDIFSLAAIALAFPYRAPVFINPSQRKNDKSAETHTEKISPYSAHFKPLCFASSEDSITSGDTEK